MTVSSWFGPRKHEKGKLLVNSFLKEKLTLVHFCMFCLFGILILFYVSNLHYNLYFYAQLFDFHMHTLLLSPLWFTLNSLLPPNKQPPTAFYSFPLLILPLGNLVTCSFMLLLVLFWWVSYEQIYLFHKLLKFSIFSLSCFWNLSVMLNVSVVHSFILLGNIPLLCYNSIYLIHLLRDLGIFLLCLLWTAW